MTNSTLIYNCRLLDEFTDSPGCLLIVDGVIRAIFEGYFTSQETASSIAYSVLQEDGIEKTSKLSLHDAKGLTITPSFIDMHVHLRYPGLTHKEDLDSALHAAASGGFGTIVAMPNTSPIVSSMEMALQIEHEAVNLGLTNVFQTVSITKDFKGEDISHLTQLEKKYIPVISEDGRDVVKEDIMLEAMKIAKEKNIIVACHCENELLGNKAKPLRKENTIKSHKKANEYLELAENTATIRNILLAKQAGCRLHICHLSTKFALDSLYNAKTQLCEPNMVTAEVTPHHLALSDEVEENLFHVVNPPIRKESDRLQLLCALRDGLIDVISSDHAPHTQEDKDNGAPGFTGLETSFAVCNTIFRTNRISPKILSRAMSSNPARILGLQKGLLKVGYDADLTVIDPDEEWVVDSSLFYSKGKYTPFEGRTLEGKVHALFLKGRKVFER